MSQNPPKNISLFNRIEVNFTGLPNAYLDFKSTINFSAYESKILAFIERKTFGFHKLEDFISYSQFTATGINDYRHIARTLKALEDKGIIFKRKWNNQTCSYGINPDLFMPERLDPLCGNPHISVIEEPYNNINNSDQELFDIQEDCSYSGVVVPTQARPLPFEEKEGLPRQEYTKKRSKENKKQYNKLEIQEADKCSCFSEENDDSTNPKAETLDQKPPIKEGQIICLACQTSFEKPVQTGDIHSCPKCQSPMIVNLQKISLPLTFILRLIKKFGASEVHTAIDIILFQHNNQIEGISNIAGYLHSILKDGGAVPPKGYTPGWRVQRRTTNQQAWDTKEMHLKAKSYLDSLSPDEYHIIEVDALNRFDAHAQGAYREGSFAVEREVKNMMEEIVLKEGLIQ